MNCVCPFGNRRCRFFRVFRLISIKSCADYVYWWQCVVCFLCANCFNCLLFSACYRQCVDARTIFNLMEVFLVRVFVPCDVPHEMGLWFCPKPSYICSSNEVLYRVFWCYTRTWEAASEDLRKGCTHRRLCYERVHTLNICFQYLKWTWLQLSIRFVRSYQLCLSE